MNQILQPDQWTDNDIEKAIWEQEQAAIAERGGMPSFQLPEYEPEPSLSSLWREFTASPAFRKAVCLLTFFVVLDIALPWSLQQYGYPRISPLLLWMPLSGCMGSAAAIALVVWAFLAARHPSR